MATLRIHVRPSVPLDALTRAPADPVPFPLDRPHRLVAGIAEALAAAAAATGLRPGDGVLVPPVLTGGRDAALRAAGLVPVVQARLAPTAVELDGVRAVLLVHHLGLPQDGKGVRALCDERRLVLLEDVTHALLAFTPDGPAGSHGHAAVAGLGAVLGLHGALMAVAGKEDPPPADGGRRLRTTERLLPHLLDLAIPGRRRGHAAWLADALGVEADLPEGASPLVLSYPVDDPRGARERLARAGVESIELPGTPAVGLPVHQRLTPADLERVAHAARPAQPRARPSLELIPLAGLDEAELPWRALQAPCGNLFATFEWASAWDAHLRGGRDLHLTLVREGGRDVALLPLVAGRVGPLRVLRLAGHGPADRLGPVCAPADLPRAATALRRALGELDADVFLGDSLAGEDGLGAMLGATTVTFQSSPVLHIGGQTWDQFLAARSRNFREQARRRERQLRKKHPDTRFRVADAATLDADLDALFALHDRRWEGATGTFTGELGAFQRDFARRALERGWLRLVLLEVEGRAVAAWEGFRFAGVEWYYQSGRDPEWERQSVGFVLLAHTVHEAMDAGMREYRLLRGGEEYKGRFATHDPGLESVALPLGAAGRAATVAGLGGMRMPAAWRTRAKQVMGRAGLG